MEIPRIRPSYQRFIIIEIMFVFERVHLDHVHESIRNFLVPIPRLIIEKSLFFFFYKSPSVFISVRLFTVIKNNHHSPLNTRS